MDDLNFELQDLLDKRVQRDKLRARIQRSDARGRERMGALKKLKEVLDAENEDVRKLEGISLASIYHTILSSKTEQLAKEREDVFQAKLAYDSCQAELAKLRREKSEQREALKALEGQADLDEALSALMQRKETWLREQAGPVAEKLVELDERLAAARAEQCEVREAARAGELAFECLDGMVQCLEKARGYGTWDLMGGGFLATGLKHSQLDEAREYAAEAQGDLFHFESELADLQIDAEFQVEIGEFNRFADYLLDGFIFDSIVHSKIQGCLADTVKTQRQVHYLLETLIKRRTSLEDQLATLEADRERCVAEDA
ncbi:MAG: hypothetical protein ACI9HE_000848 [Planctomycetota bacterium]|jgi:hypothetical protein